MTSYNISCTLPSCLYCWR